METEFSSVTNKGEKQIPNWDRYHETFRKIYGAREDQKNSHRWLIMENLDTMSFDEVLERYKNIVHQAANDAHAHGHNLLEWDVLKALRDAAKDIDSRFANAKDNHADADRKRAEGKNRACESFLKSALNELHKMPGDQQII